MTRPLLALAVSCAVLLSPNAYAQAEESPPAAQPSVSGLMEMKTKMLYFNLKPFQGQSLTQDGRPVSLGFFFSDIDKVFGEFPEAHEAARSARTWSIVGGSMYVVGMAILVTELVIILTQGSTIVSGGGDPTWYWAGLGIGGGLGILGGIFIGVAGAKFQEAVNRHNFGILNKHLPPEKKFDPALMLSQARTFSVVQGQF